jgi:hypothetical protein
MGQQQAVRKRRSVTRHNTVLSDLQLWCSSSGGSSNQGQQEQAQQGCSAFVCGVRWCAAAAITIRSAGCTCCLLAPYAGCSYQA